MPPYKGLLFKGLLSREGLLFKRRVQGTIAYNLINDIVDILSIVFKKEIILITVLVEYIHPKKAIRDTRPK